jgi:hypothetical protein
MRKNHTFIFLIVLVLGFLIGTIANIYFIFNPTSYVPSDFDPYSLWDWSIILTQALVLIYLLFLAQKVKDKYAKTFWLFVSAVCSFGIVKGYLIRDTGDLSHIISIISALECVISFSVLLIFLFLYQKHKFDLLEGFKKENGTSEGGARLVIGILFVAILGVAAWMLL